VAMDIITSMPLSHGFIVNFVVIDLLLKYAHFTDLKSYYTSSLVAVVKSFMHSTLKFHGIPQSIVVDSDNDKVFASRFLQQLF
jgi:hypothetical protein